MRGSNANNEGICFPLLVSHLVKSRVTARSYRSPLNHRPAAPRLTEIDLSSFSY
jgi:hypothetical protein